MMEFRVLGPVEIRVGDRTVDAGHARQRAVLAVLLLDLGRVVPAERLIDRVWGDAPPVSVRNALYGYIARLKAIVKAAGDGVALSRGQSGYVVEAQAECVDLFRFRRLAADAAAAVDDEQAAGLLHQALAQWHGQALIGLDSPWLKAMRDTLELEPHAALLNLNDVRLRQGQHVALVAEVTSHAASTPADERLIGQLMLALYRSGRQADALRWFEQTRRYLAAELGTDPGPLLRKLHQQILRSDTALAVAAERVKGQPGALIPRELPPDVGVFTGRATELQALTRMLDQAPVGAPGTVVISAIGGMAGVGKTALALHWAHQVSARFGDGQLHVNLRGFDPSGHPATAAQTIRGFLDALGVPAERIPASPEGQTGLYRSLLSDKRMLILLDNARDEQQVRPLLPASPGSLVIVTSRSQLGGLAAADGARLLTLDVLSRAEAVHMLTVRVGANRCAAEAAAVDRIAELCGCMPLALAVAAARAAASRSLPLAALADELADSALRLDALDAGDPGTSVRAVFSRSTRQLSGEAKRMFWLLGLHPGPDFSVPAAASLAGRGEPQARRMLRELARAHLIAEHVPGRYAFHDLLRAYAAEQAHHTGSQDEREAVGRVLDHYLHTAATAALLLVPAREPVVLAPRRLGAAAEQLADYSQATAWLEAEHQVLVGAVTLAAGREFDLHAWQLPWAMASFLRARGRWQEWAATQRVALAAATRLGDIAAQAVCSRLLGDACTYLGDNDQARSCYTSSLALYGRLGNRLGQARLQNSLAFAAERQGRYHDALGHAQQALRLYQAMGDKASEADALNAVGWYYGLVGDHHLARVFCREALTLSTETGNRRLEGDVWDSLGHAEQHLGNLAEAVACYERALSQKRESGDRVHEAEVLTHLGDARYAAGELSQAREAWQQALAILDGLQLRGADQVRVKLTSTNDDASQTTSP